MALQIGLISPLVRGVNHEELSKVFRELMETNVLGNIHLYNLLMPQILKSETKKVVLISSGMGDADLVNSYELDVSPLYSASKAAANMITAKFNAQYKKDGVLFLSICPGMVDVGHFSNGKIIFATLLQVTHVTY
jgi:NAD(P)-dependent dehydrogenase (short-subunit alcohol dehydrogenase family)